MTGPHLDGLRVTIPKGTRPGELLELAAGLVELAETVLASPEPSPGALDAAQSVARLARGLMGAAIATNPETHPEG